MKCIHCAHWIHVGGELTAAIWHLQRDCDGVADRRTITIIVCAQCILVWALSGWHGIGAAAIAEWHLEFVLFLNAAAQLKSRARARAENWIGQQQSECEKERRKPKKTKKKKHEIGIENLNECEYFNRINGIFAHALTSRTSIGLWHARSTHIAHTHRCIRFGRKLNVSPPPVVVKRISAAIRMKT